MTILFKSSSVLTLCFLNIAKMSECSSFVILSKVPSPFCNTCAVK